MHMQDGVAAINVCAYGDPSVSCSSDSGLRLIRRVLPALYEGFWACDAGRSKHQDDCGSIGDTTIALDRCELILWILYNTVRSSCKDVPIMSTSSQATVFDGLESLATARSLIK